MNQKIAVYTTDKEYAKLIINALVAKKYHKSDIIRYRTSATDIIVELKNGDFYRWVRPNSNARGIKPDISYIDIDTCSLDTIQTIITPCNLKGNLEIISSGSDSYDLDSFIDRLLKIRYLKGNLESVQVFDMKYLESNISHISVQDEKVIFIT